MSYLFDCIDTIQKFGDYPNQLFALEYGELEGNDLHEVQLNVTDDIWSLQELSPSSWSNPIAVYEFKGFRRYEELLAEAKFGDYPNQLFALEYQVVGEPEVKLNVTDDVWSLDSLSPPSPWSNPIAVYEFKGFRRYEELLAEAKFVEQLEEQLKSLDGSPIMEWLAE